MDEEYSQGGSGRMNPAGSGGIRGAASPDQHMTAGDLPPTGDDRVDAAVAGLSRLRGTPADEHVAVLEEVHGQLRDILGELNEGQDRPGEPDMAKGRP
jgi:hypothetical protein